MGSPRCCITPTASCATPVGSPTTTKCSLSTRGLTTSMVRLAPTLITGCRTTTHTCAAARVAWLHGQCQEVLRRRSLSWVRSQGHRRCRRRQWSCLRSTAQMRQSLSPRCCITPTASCATPVGSPTTTKCSLSTRGLTTSMVRLAPTLITGCRTTTHTCAAARVAWLHGQCQEVLRRRSLSWVRSQGRRRCRRLQSARSQLGDLLRVWFVLRRPLSPGAERQRIRVLQRGWLGFTVNVRRSFEGGHFLGFGARVTDDADDGNGAAYAVRHKCDSP